MVKNGNYHLIFYPRVFETPNKPIFKNQLKKNQTITGLTKTILES